MAETLVLNKLSTYFITVLYVKTFILYDICISTVQEHVTLTSRNCVISTDQVNLTKEFWFLYGQQAASVNSIVDAFTRLFFKIGNFRLKGL